MFAGIIEIVGTVRGLEPLASGRRLDVEADLPIAEVELGESIALDGACMTVAATTSAGFEVDVSAESLRRTTLGALREGDRLNIERSLRLNDRLGGHFVSGHVDGTGTIAAVTPEGESTVFTFEVPAALFDLIVEKGSVAIDGISLTAYNCEASRFDVAVVPHTARATTLGTKKQGDRVNVENDMLGKYVAKLVEAHLSRR